MTPKERLWNRLAGKKVDKIPNLSIVMLFAARYTGDKYGTFCRDYRVLVPSMIKTARDFGIDILSTMSDPFRESYDFGAKVRFQEDDLPLMTEPLISSTDEIRLLKRWDPMTSTRMLDRINACRLMKELEGDTYPILGWVEGAWAEFCDLAGVQDAMYDIIDEPELVQKGLELIAEQETDCALAQLDAGADIIGIGDAAASLVSENMYKELIFPHEKRMISRIHAAGGKVKLHICGDINHLMADMAETGADIIDIDYMVDLEKTRKILNGRAAICGQINPAGVVYQGTPEMIRKDILETVKKGGDRLNVSSGCEVPKPTPYENLMEIHRTLLSIGAQ